jgi:hypothetical protein
MQQVYKLAARPLEACVQVGDDADILGLAVEADPSAAQSRDHFLRIVRGRMIVDDFDLHRLWPWVLSKDGPQRRVEVARAVERRDNH